jgi:hypothetical protein
MQKVNLSEKLTQFSDQWKPKRLVDCRFLLVQGRHRLR